MSWLCRDEEIIVTTTAKNWNKMERTMTNEDKARAIIGGDCKKENCLKCGSKYSAEEGGCVAYQRIMQMAQWKDERIKELEATLNCRSKYERIYRNEFLKSEKQALIDKACEWMSSHLQMQYDSFGSFINAFRKAMKGGEYENDKI